MSTRTHLEAINDFFIKYAKSKNCLILIEGGIFTSSFKYNSIDEFTKSCDLHLSRFSTTVIVMERLYNNPEYIPSVSFEEIKASTKDIKRILDQWSNNPPITWKRTLGENIINSFSSDQLLLAKAKNGFPLTSLSPKQLNHVNRMLSHFYIDMKNEKLNSGEIFVSEDSYLFQKTYSNTITYGLETKGKFYSFINISEDFNFNENINNNQEIFSTTIADLSYKLCEKYKCSIIIEDCLKDKIICYFGLEYSNPASVLRALANLFRLSFTQDKSGNYLLKRNKPPVIKSITEVYTAIFEIIPYPLIKYFYGNLARIDSALQRGTQTELKSLLSKRKEKLSTCKNKLFNNSAQLLNLSKLKPKFNQLDNISKSCYGILKSYEFFYSLDRLSKSPVPIYYSRFNDLSISYNEDNNNKNISLIIKSSSNYKKVVTGMSIPKLKNNN